MVKLSIITINLNNAEGLRKTLDSVFIQTFRDYEHIIIDGASTDGSVEIIKQYAEKDHSSESIVHGSKFIVHSPVYWLSEPDKGIYNAMNKGILRAKGEYCLFLNSGDYFVDGNVLDKVFAIPFTEDVVYGFFKCDRGDHFEMGSSPREVTLRTFVEGTIHHTGNAFIRRDAFDRWGLYDEGLKIVSDWKWFLQAIGLSTATTRYVDVMLSVFDGSGLSETNKSLMDEEREQILKECIPNRILHDYRKFTEIEASYQVDIKHARNTKAYKLGKAILSPWRIIYKFVSNRLCLIYLHFLRKKYSLPKSKGEEKIVVSFTSWTKRINNVPIVVDSILKNTIKPDKIVLNLSLVEFPKKEEDLPLSVQQLISNNTIEIIWNEGNTRAFKKFIPTMRKYPNDVIIAIDDDFIYPKDFIATFMDMHRKYPDSPIAGNDYEMNYAQGHCGCASLVKREFYGKFLDILLDKKMVELGMDDIYYPFCAALNGYYYKYVGILYPTLLIPIHSEDALSSQNSGYLNFLAMNHMISLIKTRYRINLRQINKPHISFRSILSEGDYN